MLFEQFKHKNEFFTKNQSPGMLVSIITLIFSLLCLNLLNNFNKGPRLQPSVDLYAEFCLIFSLWARRALGLTEKVPVSTNPTDRILNGRTRTFFTAPQRIFCVHACMCASDLYHSRYREWAHASDALPTRESKLTSAKLENTREYSQTNIRALAIVLASTRNRTRQYLQNSVWV